MVPETKSDCERSIISVILRVTMASLLFAAGLAKFMGGLESVGGYFQTMFKDSWLPMPLVIFQARLVPWAEILLPVWLLIGWRLTLAWTATAFFLVSLAFGVIVAKQDASPNLIFVLTACAGLYFSRYDKWQHGCHKA